jgi:hypothetical protein
MAGSPGERVTRDVEPDALHDLLEQPPRATIAFVRDGCPAVLPARASVDGGHRFAVRKDDAPELDGHEVVLLIDDGPFWFQLRGISVRGIARRAAPPADVPAAQVVWYAIEARRILAWDYAKVRLV